jgi:predicted dehydrogenase
MKTGELDMEVSLVSPIKVLVVGTGFGCRIQVPALRAAGFDVVGLVGTDPKRTVDRAAANGVPRAFIDVGQGIVETGAVAVSISTPPTTHCEVTLTALRHGCHVLCEKPFAANAGEAREMLLAARQAGVIHLVGHEFRFIPQRALVARSVAKGLIGAPRFFAHVHFNSYVAQFSRRMPNWWFSSEAAGGWLGASGSHVIDQVRHELGEIAAVSAALPQVSPGASSVEDSFVIRMRLTNGAEGAIQQTGGALGPPAGLFRVAGTEGSIWIDNDKVCLATRGGTQELEIPNDLLLPQATPSIDPRQQTLEWQRLTSLELSPYTQLCKHLRAKIEANPPPGPVSPATFEDGVRSMNVLEAVRESARRGGMLIDVGSGPV